MKMIVKNNNMTWKPVYENMDYDYDAAMLFKKEASKQRIAAWSEAEEWLYPNKLKPVLWHILWYESDNLDA